MAERTWRNFSSHYRENVVTLGSAAIEVGADRKGAGGFREGSGRGRPGVFDSRIKRTERQRSSAARRGGEAEASVARVRPSPSGGDPGEL